MSRNTKKTAGRDETAGREAGDPTDEAARATADETIGDDAIDPDATEIEDPSAAAERPRRRAPIDRRAKRTRAIVVVPIRTQPNRSGAAAEARDRTGEPAGSPDVRRSVEARREEAIGLARAIDLDVAESLVVRIAEPKPGTLIGSGKVEEIAELAKTHEAELVIVDHALSPIQQRNLEKAWSAKVLDRTGLILEIFGERARTKEGRLQVEHAHLTYQKSRLVRSWTHLERQRGGFGFLGGPGETQIEADRRLIQERIAKLERELEAVKRTRALHRKTRKKVPHPVVALVGYTNAGKSTLFNRLTAADVLAKDLLFATLDPTLRRVKLPGGSEVILSDTVGFVSDLPTTLVAAFRATLEEVIEADLILHVRDIAHEDTAAQAKDVAEVLRILGVDVRDAEKVIEVWNKIDRLDPGYHDKLLAEGVRVPGDGPATVPVSALTGEGVATLLGLVEDRLNRDRASFEIVVPGEEGELIAWLYRNAEVLGREDRETGIRLRVRVAPKALDLFRSRAGRYIVEADTSRSRRRA